MNVIRPQHASNTQHPLSLRSRNPEASLAWPEVIACLAAAYARADDPRAAPPKVVARSGRHVAARADRNLGHRRVHGCEGDRERPSRAAPSISSHCGTRRRARSRPSSRARTSPPMRTAGTSAVAIDRIAPKTPLKVAVLGSGHEATTHVSALAAVREMASLAVYSPDCRKPRTLRAARCGRAPRAVPCGRLRAREAIEGADLVIAAARSRDETPILEGAWLVPGMMVVSIGSTVPEQREVDPEVVRRADVIVADVPDEVANETGDMIAARRRASISATRSSRWPTSSQAARACGNPPTIS